jgi:hypothetical protein
MTTAENPFNFRQEQQMMSEMSLKDRSQETGMFAYCEESTVPDSKSNYD